MGLIDEFPGARGSATYEGLIKLKLVHAQGFSVLLPDVLVVGDHWFQARFFSPPMLSWLPGGGACCRFSFELDPDTKLDVVFCSDGLLSTRADGAGVYRCQIGGPQGLAGRADGECDVKANGEIRLWLYHHTAPETVDAIRSCRHFRGSAWNIQGTQKQLVNVRYVYFTSLPSIKSDEDLEQIAMASRGFIQLTPTNAPKDIIRLRVYRQSTINRRASLRMLVPAETVASQHVYRHAPHDEPVYYEIPHAHIFKVGLLPGKVLPINGDEVAPTIDDLKQFDYVVLGDADTRTGLRAPYDEEETRALFKVERMTPGEDLFALWQKHANADRASVYAVEMAEFRGT